MGLPLDAVVASYVYNDRPRFLFYVLLASAGSAVGSSVIYLIGYLGGETLLRKRIPPARYEKIHASFDNHEFWALMFPAMLPPPFPFKLFVLAAAGFEMRFTRFLAAIFGITGWQERWWPAWFPVAIFLPFIADATATLIYRLLRGARVWEAHREHYYQRLVQIGWGHGRALALYATLMVGIAGSSLVVLTWAPTAGIVLLIVWAGVLALIFGVIEYHWRRRGVGFEESKG